MPRIKRPRTGAQRDAAMRTGKNRKDAVPAPIIIPYTAGTITRLDLFQPVYRTKYLALTTTKNAQTALTALVEEAKKQGIYIVLDFVDALNRAIRRKLFLPSDRTFYNIDVNNSNAPVINTEEELITWGLNLADGEAARIAAGGAPITFPSIAQVTAAISLFQSLNAQQAFAKEAYDVAQEALEAEAVEADKLILKMWNETETAFDEGNKSSMRRKCREWGLVYELTPGEAPSPDDFSIIGTLTDSATGNPLADVAVSLTGTSVIVLTDNDGKYYIDVQPAGTYTIHLMKGGYLEKDIVGVVVVDGAITTVNGTMATAVSTGTISGNVNAPGFPTATVSVAGTGLTATTDPMGNYTITGVPAGLVTLECFLNSDPANIKTQTPTVVAGATVTVNFSFP